MRHRYLILLAAALLGGGVARAAAYDGTTAPPAAAAGPLPDGDGGLAGLSKEELATIRKVRDLLGDLAGNTGLPWNVRRDAVAARRRLHEALNDWGREGQLDFYLDLFVREPNPYVRGELAHNAMCAAKARQPHLGGVRALWRKIDALAEETGRKLSSQTQRVRGYLTQCERPFKAAADLDCRLKPYVLVVPKLSLGSTLRPYKEPARRNAAGQPPKR